MAENERALQQDIQDIFSIMSVATPKACDIHTWMLHNQLKDPAKQIKKSVPFIRRPPMGLAGSTGTIHANYTAYPSFANPTLQNAAQIFDDIMTNIYKNSESDKTDAKQENHYVCR